MGVPASRRFHPGEAGTERLLRARRRLGRHHRNSRESGDRWDDGETRPELTCYERWKIIFPEPFNMEVERFELAGPGANEISVETEATWISTGSELTALTGE